MAKIKNWGLLALAASFPLAMGQMDHGTHSMPSEASDTSKPSPSGTPETHVVLVGYQGNSFLPNNTKANIGDTIEFQFLPKNHSVVRAGVRLTLDWERPYESVCANYLPWLL